MSCFEFSSVDCTATGAAVVTYLLPLSNRNQKIIEKLWDAQSCGRQTLRATIQRKALNLPYHSKLIQYTHSRDFVIIAVFIPKRKEMLRYKYSFLPAMKVDFFDNTTDCNGGYCTRLSRAREAFLRASRVRVCYFFVTCRVEHSCCCCWWCFVTYCSLFQQKE